MSKRNYTHIKELLPTIEAMVAEGMTQREIAEHFGFKDKFVVKACSLSQQRRTGLCFAWKMQYIGGDAADFGLSPLEFAHYSSRLGTSADRHARM